MTERLDLATQILVIGGGPAASWAALTAHEAGFQVVIVDKGYLGTSGATAPSNTGTWFVPPGEGRRSAIERRRRRSGGLDDPRQIHRLLDTSWQQIHRLAERGYAFPTDAEGAPYLANLRGPDYMAFMRRLLVKAGIRILDHHPALELLAHEGVVAGAAGIDRQRNRAWTIRADAVVLATGGCAFAERMLGATGLTGDGYLMAAEAGATLSGMEFSCQYGLAPFESSLNKGLPFFWASFTREDGSAIEDASLDRHQLVAAALRDGPVYACYDKAAPELRDPLRRGQPNCFLPLDRAGIDPFTQRFQVTLRCEGTVRGIGGIALRDDDGSTGVPGLYAAGDAASRESVTGAISGGGGPNASWAIASGTWAGRAAAGFAARHPGGHARPVVALGRAGLRPNADAAEANSAAVRTVKAEFLPIERNFFRRGDRLWQSLDRLDAAWADIATHGGGLVTDGSILRGREAAGLVATSRWAYTAAMARRESRGMHRRSDAPHQLVDFDGRIEVAGFEHIVTRHYPSARLDSVAS